MKTYRLNSNVKSMDVAPCMSITQIQYPYWSVGIGWACEYNLLDMIRNEVKYNPKWFGLYNCIFRACIHVSKQFHTYICSWKKFVISSYSDRKTRLSQGPDYLNSWSCSFNRSNIKVTSQLDFYGWIISLNQVTKRRIKFCLGFGI